ncbi:ionotropic receptor 21a-like [Panulirus ornatus]|uniref:ionotropic receptor 21a-like n=1 Tax=Panulirus ornatus TaxID=150431 RepID=UPI003A896C66
MRASVVMVMLLLAESAAKSPLNSGKEKDAGGLVVGAVLEAMSEPSCSLILFTDSRISSSTVLKAVSSEGSSPRGVTVMEVTAADGQDANVTLAMLSHLVDLARRVRLGSWCVRVVVVSHDPAFLSSFAESSLKGRLLVWATRLLVVTSLTLPQLYALLPAHWTFSMMNTIFLNLEDTSPNLRYRLHNYLPYSPDGGGQVVRAAFWSTAKGITHLNGRSLFPQKFSDFYGAKVNITSRSWPPYWDEADTRAPDGTVVKQYSGSDYLTLKTVSEALNFTINVVPTSSWAEVVEKVEERVAFMASVYHGALPDRWKRYDFSYIYEMNHMSFCMAKPGLRTQWQSLFYPLNNKVWATLLAALLLMPTLFIMLAFIWYKWINPRRRQWEEGTKEEDGTRLVMGTVAQEVMGVLVGQSLPLRLPATVSSRLLLTLWMMFALVIGASYRGNLIAALTLPRYPPRPEAVEQLVATVDRVTMSSFGGAWIKYFVASDSEVYRKLAVLLESGYALRDGLQMALEQNTAQMNGRRYMANMIAEHFTRADGSTQLYLGREPVIPQPSGWPIPHDAPYKPQLDRCLMAIIEGGLYEKWSEDILTQTRQRSQRRQREYVAQQQREQQQGMVEGTESDSRITALTLIHMQGPLMLLLLGLAVAGITFTGETVVKRLH